MYAKKKYTELQGSLMHYGIEGHFIPIRMTFLQGRRFCVLSPGAEDPNYTSACYTYEHNA